MQNQSQGRHRALGCLNLDPEVSRVLQAVSLLMDVGIRLQYRILDLKHDGEIFPLRRVSSRLRLLTENSH